MHAADVNEAVLNGLLGRALVGWESREEAMLFTLDDGRTVAVIGAFAIQVYRAQQQVTH